MLPRKEIEGMKASLVAAVEEAKRKTLERLQKTCPIETTNCAAVIDEFLVDLDDVLNKGKEKAHVDPNRRSEAAGHP